MTLHTFIHFSNEFFKIDVFHTKKIYTLILPHIVTTVTILEKNTFFDTAIIRKITIDAKDLAVYAKLKEQREFNASGRSLLWDSSH